MMHKYQKQDCCLLACLLALLLASLLASLCYYLTSIAFYSRKLKQEEADDETNSSVHIIIRALYYLFGRIKLDALHSHSVIRSLIRDCCSLIRDCCSLHCSHHASKQASKQQSCFMMHIHSRGHHN